MVLPMSITTDENGGVICYYNHIINSLVLRLGLSTHLAEYICRHPWHLGKTEAICIPRVRIVRLLQPCAQRICSLAREKSSYQMYASIL